MQVFNLQEALQGVNVLDFTWVAAGPLTTRYFADFGASVIKIESRSRIDPLRTAGPFMKEPGENNSLYFANYNVGKLSMTLNIKHAKSRNIIKRLIEWADIVTENFTPGTIEKWGLGFEELKRMNPRIILFSTSMLGRGGPRSGQPGFGPVLSALSGLTYITGMPDGFPVSPYGAFTDFIAPKFAVTAILAAMEYVEQVNEGIHIEISQLEAALQFIAPLLLAESINNQPTVRRGNADTNAAPHNVFPCKGEDRWVAISVYTDSEWDALCQAMENPAWAMQEKFKSGSCRKVHEDELNSQLALWTASYDCEQLVIKLQARNICAGTVQNASDLYQDPQLMFRQHFYQMNHPTMGKHYIQQNEARFISDIVYEKNVPLLGEHTDYICRKILNLSESEIKVLRDEGALY